MYKITQEELKTIVEKHQHWLRQDCDGWYRMSANFSGIDLSGMDLSGMDLRCANLKFICLCEADLTGTNLVMADLSDALLKNANLSNAKLFRANLHDTNLNQANLSMANLSMANLSSAVLTDSILRNADLSGSILRNADLRAIDARGTVFANAELYGADLRGADLKDAILHYADLDEACLDDVNNMPDIPYACPETGSFIGWKKVRDHIVKLEIPEDAKRSSATSEKCRCNKARVLGIETYDGAVAYEKKVASYYDRCFIYEVGKTVAVYNFDTNRWRECASGIHFFMNRDDAVSY